LDKAESKKELRLDRPLRPGKALDADALDRRAFASRVTEVLRRITPDEGLVVSVEGPWGSAKTSVLAMVEELLNAEPDGERPLVVHFNPWLIGDREALLRQFLASIAKAVRLTDHAKEGKRVAKELKTYSKAFDVLKLIPGAEPWASIVKSVVESVGDATGAAAEHKTPDVEARKDALEKALRKFPQRIVVLLDDLDRLYPSEAFEMVRIVKAVGDLPNVGYVLAWDEKYVSAALERLNVPFAGNYLDKVVQVRLPIPPLSFSQRMALMNQGLQRLPPEALVAHFPNGDDRLASLFHAGQRELVEQPRDVVRLFDVVAAIEPGLRGEVHLADMLGLATLMTKAPAVYDLLCRTPQAFVGRRPGATASFDKPLEVIQSFADERNKAIDSYPCAKGVRDVVHWLFPQTAKADDVFTLDRVVFLEGHLAHPERLQVALHLSARPGDLSLVRVRQYLFEPAKRGEIAATLQQDNCIDVSVWRRHLDSAAGRGEDARAALEWERSEVGGFSRSSWLPAMGQQLVDA
jgi:predicted KAP-like P-loop ATPase